MGFMFFGWFKQLPGSQLMLSSRKQLSTKKTANQDPEEIECAEASDHSEDILLKPKSRILQDFKGTILAILAEFNLRRHC